MGALAGRVALVTGGATGIGAAIAIALADAGADVAVTANVSGPDRVLDSIRSAGRRGTAISVDLGRMDAAGMDGLVQATEAALGPVSILVNNAGIIRRDAAVDYGEADWDDVLDLNLTSVWKLSQAAGRRMVAQGQGAIINTASLLSFQGGVRVPAYAAAKHGVAGLTRALANEWAASGVNVNAIAPGYIETANTEALLSDETRSRQILERIPAGRWGRPEDVAGTAVFLASPAAAYLHGQIIAVDGGWMAR
ncbi:SDR family oxidoreductase [Roseobacter sinensis]|uniref:SDR family oxidoreductase n=1 Tax=Roseobacter sinensis TaxID=2931391 RepID=A0ABT3BFG5_9RHOB|nr:SDR family oxidoreductase [Roseobacter sp. WL0113]MCV3272307.1 SDR family oxidoreductase [Roseobacter sp. WL0113]